MAIVFQCKQCGRDRVFEEGKTPDEVSCGHCGGPLERIESASDSGPGEEDDIWPDLEAAAARADVLPDRHVASALIEEEEVRPETAEETAAAHRMFWRDARRLVLPGRSPADWGRFVVFCVLPGFIMFPIPEGCMVLLLLPLRIVALGFFVSILFSVTMATANGGNELPGVLMLDSFGDTLRPMVRFIGAFFYISIPAVAFTVVWLATGRSKDDFLDSGAATITFNTLFTLGLFFLPQVALIMAGGDSYLLRRPDRMLASIRRTKGPYLGCFASLLAAYGSWYWVLRGSVYKYKYVEDYPAMRVWALVASISLVGTALSVYAMRVIGLLYRYCRRWMVWEL